LPSANPEPNLATFQNKYLVILNPFSGKGRARRYESKIVRFFETNGLAYVVEHTKSPKDATRIANDFSDSEFTHFVVCGGDGTLHEVVNGVDPDSGKIIAFIPLGTINIFARETGIPREIDAALALLLNGPVREIPVGKSSEKKFILMVSIGLDSYVVQNVTSTLKKAWGAFAYAFVFFKSLFSYTYPTIRVEINGSLFNGAFVLISKCRKYAGFFAITPDARIDSDSLSVCILKKRGIFPTLKLLILSLVQKNHLNKDCIFINTKRVIILAPDARSQIDGEPGGIPSLEISIDCEKIRCIMGYSHDYM